MTTIYRARLLDFTDEPMDGEGSSAVRYVEDGGLAVADGMIIGRGDFPEVHKAHPDATQERDVQPAASLGRRDADQRRS